MLAVFTAAACLCTVSGASASSLRYFGNGVNDIDRVKIRIDDPADNNPGPPADVGNGDFTLEFWVRSNNENQAAAISCGSNNNWITGNIVIDRDRFAQGREWGISLGEGRIAFGVTNGNFDAITVCGSTDIRDDRWHHVAVQRRRSDGRLWIWVDGSLEAEQDGPDGDISYPDDGVPMDRCGPSASASCDFSDPFIVIGAEKHDAPGFASFSGWVDEFRISTSLRYLAPFSPPTQAFSADGDTAALYHFDEGSGDLIVDFAAGGLSPGERRFGGSPAGPVWVADTPFASGGSAGSLQFTAGSYAVDESGNTMTVAVTRSGGSSGAVTVDYATADGSAMSGADYVTATGSLSWPDGDALQRSFDVTIVDDQQSEGSETVNLSLSNPTGGAVIGVPATATLTITDDDATMPGELVLGAAAYSVGEAQGSVTVLVQRAGGADGPVGVSYSVAGGTSTRGADYGISDGTLNWADGDSGDRSIVIPIIDDGDVEGDETANVVLSSPTGGAALGSPSSAVLTIVDDDAPAAGTLQLSSDSYSAGEGSAVLRVTVTRTGGSSGAVTAGFTTIGETATAGEDFQSVAGELQWDDGDAAARTVDVTIIDDAAVEAEETLRFELTMAGGGAALGVPTVARVSIADNDLAPPPPGPPPPTASSGGGGAVGLAFPLLAVLASLLLGPGGVRRAARRMSGGVD